MARGYLVSVQKKERSSLSWGKLKTLETMDVAYNLCVILGMAARGIAGVCVLGALATGAVGATNAAKNLGMVGLGGIGVGVLCWGSLKIMMALEKKLMGPGTLTHALR